MNSSKSPDRPEQSTGWYAFLKGETKGPFEKAVLREMLVAGLISDDTPVAQAGSTAWQSASSVLSQTTQPPPLPTGPKPSDTSGEFRSLLRRCKAIAELNLTAKHWAICSLLGLGLLVIAPSMCSRPSSAPVRQTSTGENSDRFWAQQSDKLVRETTGGSNMCARCSGTGRIQGSGGRTNWSASPDSSDRLRTGADPFRCDSCGGQGTIETPSGYVTACPECAGRGRATSRTCDACGGTGRWK